MSSEQTQDRWTIWAAEGDRGWVGPDIGDGGRVDVVPARPGVICDEVSFKRLPNGACVAWFAKDGEVVLEMAEQQIDVGDAYTLRGILIEVPVQVS